MEFFPGIDVEIDPAYSAGRDIVYDDAGEEQVCKSGKTGIVSTDHDGIIFVVKTCGYFIREPELASYILKSLFISSLG